MHAQGTNRQLKKPFCGFELCFLSHCSADSVRALVLAEQNALVCRPVPADHKYLCRTEAQLLKLPGKKYDFSAKQKQVQTLHLPVNPAVSICEKGSCFGAASCMTSCTLFTHA